MNTGQSMFAQARSDYYKAQNTLSTGDAAQVLMLVRQSLEGLVKSAATECGIQTNEGNVTVTLKDTISQMREAGLIGEREVSLLHRVRTLGNKGAHRSQVPPTMEEAEEGVEKLGISFSFLENKLSRSEVVAHIREKANIPMENPDYYSKNRRYFGAWANIYNEKLLRTNTDYTRLETLAENGDIQAMLDLASGFLSQKNMDFDENSLLYNADWYYFWVGKACDTACSAADRGCPFSKKYIATALLEGAKYLIFKANDKQILNAITYLRLLISLKKQYPGDIISRVHDERSLDQIKYLFYLTCYLGQLLRFFTQVEDKTQITSGGITIQRLIYYTHAKRFVYKINERKYWVSYDSDNLQLEAPTQDSEICYIKTSLYYNPDCTVPSPYILSEEEVITPHDAGRIVTASLMRQHQNNLDFAHIFSKLSERITVFEVLVLVLFYLDPGTREAFSEFLKSQKLMNISYSELLIDNDVEKQIRTLIIAEEYGKNIQIRIMPLSQQTLTEPQDATPKSDKRRISSDSYKKVIAMSKQMEEKEKIRSYYVQMNGEKKFLSSIGQGQILVGKGPLAETAARIIRKYLFEGKSLP